jgi:hypothetical protein
MELAAPPTGVNVPLGLGDGLPFPWVGLSAGIRLGATEGDLKSGGSVPGGGVGPLGAGVFATALTMTVPIMRVGWIVHR